MEKQLVDAFNSVDSLSKLDEVTQDMIIARAKEFNAKIDALARTFSKAFEVLVESEPELCKLIEPTLLMVYTDWYTVTKHPDDFVQTSCILGSRKYIERASQYLLRQVLGVLKGEVGDVLESTVQEG